MLSLICTRINSWVNNHEAGDLRHHRTHYDVIVMTKQFPNECPAAIPAKHVVSITVPTSLRSGTHFKSECHSLKNAAARIWANFRQRSQSSNSKYYRQYGAPKAQWTIYWTQVTQLAQPAQLVQLRAANAASAARALIRSTIGSMGPQKPNEQYIERRWRSWRSMRSWCSCAQPTQPEL